MAKLKSLFWTGVSVYVAWTVASLILELIAMTGDTGAKIETVLTAFRSKPISTLKNLHAILSQ